MDFVKLTTDVLTAFNDHPLVIAKKQVRFFKNEPDGTPASQSVIRDCRVDDEAKGRVSPTPTLESAFIMD